jgi:hypothetical protein
LRRHRQTGIQRRARPRHGRASLARPGVIINKDRARVTALAEGLNWEWESFPEYLDALDRMPRTIDIAAQIPHHPLRVFVMGERGINREAATPDDIAEMRRLTEAALRAGAFGFTTSRTYSHKTNTGDLVPGHFAEEAELYGIGQAMASVGSGAFGMNSDFVDEEAEFAWMHSGAAAPGPRLDPNHPQKGSLLHAGSHRRDRMSRIGIAISGGPNPAEIVDLVDLAESLGYESAWVAEGHGGDQFAILAACATRTSRILLGTSISSVFVRTAPTIAMAASTVADMSGGRFIPWSWVSEGTAR